MPAGSGAEGWAFTIAGNDVAQIGPITFTGAGIYEYELRCVTPTRADYTIAGRVYTIRVYVKEDLTHSVVVREQDGEKADTLSFGHTYTRPGSGGGGGSDPTRPSNPELMVDPPVVKTVSGDPVTPGAFTFRLTAGSSSNPMPPGSVNGVKTIQVTGAGRAEFGVWAYTRGGVYTYTVTEVNGGEAGYTYDTEVYTITDTVRAVSGRFEVSRAVTDGAGSRTSALAFANTYGPVDPNAPNNPSDPNNPNNPNNPSDPNNLSNPNAPGAPTDGPSRSGGNAPQTGDSAPILRYAITGAISLLLLIFLLWRRSSPN
jgi:pilin isopeptide linkage protein